MSHLPTGKLPYTGRDPRIKEGPEYLILGPRRTESPSRSRGPDIPDASYEWTDLDVPASTSHHLHRPIQYANSAGQPSSVLHSSQSQPHIAAFYPGTTPMEAVQGPDTVPYHPQPGSTPPPAASAKSVQHSWGQVSHTGAAGAESIASSPKHRWNPAAMRDDTAMSSPRDGHHAQAAWEHVGPAVEPVGWSSPEQQISSQHGYDHKSSSEAAAYSQQQQHASPPAPTVFEQQLPGQASDWQPGSSGSASSVRMQQQAGGRLPSLHHEAAQQHGANVVRHAPYAEPPAVWQQQQQQQRQGHIHTANERPPPARPAALLQQQHLRRSPSADESKDCQQSRRQQQAVVSEHAASYQPLAHDAHCSERKLQPVGRVSAELEPYWRSPAEGPCPQQHARSSDCCPCTDTCLPSPSSISATRSMVSEDRTDHVQRNAYFRASNDPANMQHWHHEAAKPDLGRQPAHDAQLAEGVGMEAEGPPELHLSRQLAGSAYYVHEQQHISEPAPVSALHQHQSTRRSHDWQHHAVCAATAMNSSDRRLVQHDLPSTADQTSHHESGTALDTSSRDTMSPQEASQQDLSQPMHVSLHRSGSAFESTLQTSTGLGSLIQMQSDANVVLNSSSGLHRRPLPLIRTLSDHDPGHLLSASPLKSRHVSQQPRQHSNREPSDAFLTQGPELSESPGRHSNGTAVSEASSTDGFHHNEQEHGVEEAGPEHAADADIRMEAGHSPTDSQELASDGSGESMVYDFDVGGKPGQGVRLLQPANNGFQPLPDSLSPACLNSPASLDSKPGSLGCSHSPDDHAKDSSVSSADSHPQAISPIQNHGSHTTAQQLPSRGPSCPPKQATGRSEASHVEAPPKQLSSRAQPPQKVEPSGHPEGYLHEDDDKHPPSTDSLTIEDALQCNENVRSHASACQAEARPATMESPLPQIESPVPHCSEDPVPRNGRPLGSTWGDQKASTTSSHFSPLQAGLTSGRHSEEWAHLPSRGPASWSESSHAAHPHVDTRGAEAAGSDFVQDHALDRFREEQANPVLRQHPATSSMDADALSGAHTVEEVHGAAQQAGFVGVVHSREGANDGGSIQMSGPLRAGLSAQEAGPSSAWGPLEGHASPGPTWHDSVSDQVSSECLSPANIPERRTFQLFLIASIKGCAPLFDASSSWAAHLKQVTCNGDTQFENAEWLHEACQGLSK